MSHTNVSVAELSAARRGFENGSVVSTTGYSRRERPSSCYSSATRSQGPLLSFDQCIWTWWIRCWCLGAGDVGPGLCYIWPRTMPKTTVPVVLLDPGFNRPGSVPRDHWYKLPVPASGNGPQSRHIRAFSQDKARWRKHVQVTVLEVPFPPISVRFVSRNSLIEQRTKCCACARLAIN